MDEYDFNLFENNKTSRRTRGKPPAEVKPINHCKRKYSKKIEKHKVPKHTKNIAKMVAEYQRRRPSVYLEAAEKVGLKWEETIYVQENEDKNEASPPKKTFPPACRGTTKVDLEE